MAPDLNCISPALLMEGYLRKSKKWSKRYFVLREGPPRLEYYDSAKRKTGRPKRCINLENAWNIDKKVTSRHKHLIGIYTETEYFAMGADNEAEQENWVQALRKVVLGCKGYLNRSLMYKHIWQGNVDTRDLENCSSTTRVNLQGYHRCCLTDKTMVFVSVNSAGACNLLPRNHVEITIGSIRSCGHKENMFFMEPGRSSGIGTGKLWMELEDSAIASNMHNTILALWNLGQDDSRQRSYSFGSSANRPSNNRSRHYYNPPPSQVGLGKPTNPAHSIPKQVSTYAVSRNRCESFPATQATTLTDESRYRTSSEGETTMKRHYPLHSLTIRRKPGSVSPSIRTRVYSQGKRPLYMQPSSILHFRTSSLPGSYTSSSNSSIEHINTALEYGQNGQSPATSESQGSSDEFSHVGLIDILSQAQLSHPQFGYAGIEMAPPPPSIPPETTPILTTGSTPTSTVQESEYSCMQPSHSRSHSMDDNLSCDTGASSSLSSSPQVMRDILGLSPSPDINCLYGQSPSQNSPYSHMADHVHICTPTSASSDDYSIMSPGSSESYPHEAANLEPPSSDYTPMTPGRGAATSTPAENKSGYVPMRPLIRSQPQDIVSSRRRSLSENRLVNGSYSPVSPLSRSPDKPPQSARGLVQCVKCKRHLPHSYPCQCSVVTSAATPKGPVIPPVSLHGLKVDPKNDFSLPIKSGYQPPVNHSEDYADMNGLSRGVATMQLRPSPSELAKEAKPSMSSGGDIDHEYLPMSPMNAGNSKKSVVGNVLSIVESASNAQSGITSTPKYPHQQNISSPVQYSTNSLDRSSKQPRKRTKSLGISLLKGDRNSSRGSKHGRKHSLRVSTDKSTSESPSSNNPVPPQSPGGEYVSIDFDKAKKQVGPDYMSLTDPTELSSSPSGSKVTHDSNRNILPAKQPSPKDNTLVINKPGRDSP